MTTTRQMEKFWTAGQYGKLVDELLAGRPEERPAVRNALQPMLAAAALSVIRLDELAGSHQPLARGLVAALLARQGGDGGWSDPLTTALVVRALCCTHGDGLAVRRGINYLADLQKSEGLWPVEPLRRMPADATATAFVLLQLGDDERFRQAVRFEEAMAWFGSTDRHLDADASELWRHARLRCDRQSLPTADAEAYLWS